MNLDPNSIACIIAALDGHDPSTNITPTSVTSTRSPNPSDLTLCAQDLLQSTPHPMFAVRDLARSASDVITATALACGKAPDQPLFDHVVRILRTELIALREEEGDDWTDE